MNYSDWILQNPNLINAAVQNYGGQPTYRPTNQQTQFQTAQMQGGNNALGMAQSIYSGIKGLVNSAKDNNTEETTEASSEQPQQEAQAGTGAQNNGAPPIQAYEQDDDQGSGLGKILGLVGKFI